MMVPWTVADDIDAEVKDRETKRTGLEWVE